MTGAILAFAIQETELRIFVLVTGPNLTRTILCEVSLIHVGIGTIQCELFACACEQYTCGQCICEQCTCICYCDTL